MKSGQKEIFTVNGHIEKFEGRHRFIPNSSPYLNENLRKMPEGKKISCTFSEQLTSRSGSQLAYHWVLVGYIADYCGYTKEECHDGIMRLHFGEKQIKIGNKSVMIRKSIANRAYLPKFEVMGLIQYDLDICINLGIKVPTALELGYIDVNEKIDSKGLPEYPKENLKPSF